MFSGARHALVGDIMLWQPCSLADLLMCSHLEVAKSLHVQVWALLARVGGSATRDLNKMMSLYMRPRWLLLLPRLRTLALTKKLVVVDIPADVAAGALPGGVF